MKIKFGVKCFLVFLVGLGVALFIYWNTYTEFEPIIYTDSDYKRIHIEDNKKFYKDLAIVLAVNNIEYRIDRQGKLLIKRRLSGNKELMFNYTKKALDTAWIRSHVKQN